MKRERRQIGTDEETGVPEVSHLVEDVIPAGGKKLLGYQPTKGTFYCDRIRITGDIRDVFVTDVLVGKNRQVKHFMEKKMRPMEAIVFDGAVAFNFDTCRPYEVFSIELENRCSQDVKVRVELMGWESD